jgi:hypothetical protein
MARLITLSFPASSTTYFATNINGAGAIYLSIPYPLVFLNLARKLTLSSPDDLSAVDFLITGTDQFGNPLSEILAGPNNNTVTTVNQYHTILSIGAGGLYTNLSIGIGSTGTFQWIKVNTLNVYPIITITGEVTGTINYSINQTLDTLEYSKNISSNIGQGSTLKYIVNTTPVSFPITGALTNATTNEIFTMFTPVTALQAIVNSSAGGTLTVNILQQGII